MIIVKVQGGLGNQLFQYAFGRVIAKRLGVELKLDVSHFAGQQAPKELAEFPRSVKLHEFQVEASLATEAEIAEIRGGWRGDVVGKVLRRGLQKVRPEWCIGHFKERTQNYDSATRRIGDGTYLEGFWQSPKYLGDQEAVIRREFDARDPALAELASGYIQQLRQRYPGQAIVALHVRRGDLARAEQLGRLDLIPYPPTSIDYIQRAAKLFDDLKPAPLFLVFSESPTDLDWCRESIQLPQVELCSGHNDLQDFAIMRECDHFIIANSTFSWWAAWLGENPAKRVVSPERWFFPDRFPDHKMSDLLPADWKTA